MATPGWFREVFEAYVREIMQMNQRGVKMDPYDGADILWDMIYRQSERMTARALEELFGAKEVPIMMTGGIVSRKHVDQIAKFLVNRGGIADKEEDLFPDGVDESHGAPGTSYRKYEEWERRPPTRAVGDAPRSTHTTSRDVPREKREADGWVDQFSGRQVSKLEEAARNAMQRPTKGIGFVDDEGRVHPT